MRNVNSRRGGFAALLMIALTGSFAACGDSNDLASEAKPPASVPENAIAQVGSVAIPKASFNRLLKSKITGVSPITAKSSAAQLDAPRFTKCKASLRKSALEANAALPAKQRAKPASDAELLASCKAQLQQLRQATTAQLIQYQWLIQSAAALGISVSDRKVAQTIEQYAAASGAQGGKPARSLEVAQARFNAKLRASGLTEADLETQVRAQLVQQGVFEQRAKEYGELSDVDVKEFYENNPQLFGTPSQRSVAVVVSADEETAKQAAQALEKKQPIGTVAKRYSTDPNSLASGGVAKVFDAPGVYPESVRNEFFAAELREIKGPIEADGRWYVFSVLATEPADLPPFAKVKRNAREQAAATRVSRTQIEIQNELQEAWRPNTLCAKAFLVPQCSNGPKLPALPVPGE